MPCRAQQLDLATIATIGDAIRDGEFSDADVSFDRGSGTVELAIWQADDRTARYEPAGLFGLWRVAPMRKLTLVCHSVSDVQARRDNPAKGFYTIGGLEWQRERVLCIHSYDGITVELTMPSLTWTDCVDSARERRTRVWRKGATADEQR